MVFHTFLNLLNYLHIKNNNKIGIIVNSEGYEGYSINELEFEKA